MYLFKFCLPIALHSLSLLKCNFKIYKKCLYKFFYFAPAPSLLCMWIAHAPVNFVNGYILISIISIYNRGIKTQRINKYHLYPQQSYKNIEDQYDQITPLVIIGQLGLVELTNRKMGRKDVNKQINRQFVNEITIMFCYLIYILSSRLPINQLNKP